MTETLKYSMIIKENGVSFCNRLNILKPKFQLR